MGHPENAGEVERPAHTYNAILIRGQTSLWLCCVSVSSAKLVIAVGFKELDLEAPLSCRLLRVVAQSVLQHHSLHSYTSMSFQKSWRLLEMLVHKLRSKTQVVALNTSFKKKPTCCDGVALVWQILHPCLQGDDC